MFHFFFGRLLKLFRNKPEQLPVGDLRLGLSVKKACGFDLPDKLLTQHTMLHGPNDAAAKQLMANLVAQQISRGGGVLVLDSADNAGFRPGMLVAATRAGRAAELAPGHDLGSEGGLAQALRTNLIYHVELQPNGEEYAGYVLAEVTEAIARRRFSHQLQHATPFLVVISDALGYLDTVEQWVQRARVAHCGILVHLQADASRVALREPSVRRVSDACFTQIEVRASSASSGTPDAIVTQRGKPDGELIKLLQPVTFT